MFYYYNLFNYKEQILTYLDIFDDVVVRLYDKEAMFENDLEKDFLNIFNLNYQEFELGFFENSKLDLIGMNLLNIINKEFPYFKDKKVNKERTELNRYIELYLKENKKFSYSLPKEIIYKNKEYFDDINEFIRINYFNNKKKLFNDVNIDKEKLILNDDCREVINIISNFFIAILKDKNKKIRELENNIKK